MNGQIKRLLLSSSIGLAAGVLLALWIRGWTAYALSPGGSEMMLHLANVSLAGGYLGAFPLMILLAAFAVLPQARRPALLGLIAAVIGFMAFVTLVWGVTEREEAFVRVITNVEPLVRAVEDFEKEFGRAPTSLTELIPEHLPALPETTVGAWPTVRYDTPRDGKPWRMAVPVPESVLDFSELFYEPTDENPGHWGQYRSRQGRLWVHFVN
jgi:hypothetical protein